MKINKPCELCGKPAKKTIDKINLKCNLIE